MTVVGKKNATSQIDELKRRIGAEQVALDCLQAQTVELQAERQSALLADDDAPLEAAEAAILANLRQAERHRARLDAALAELEVAEEEQRQEEALADYQRAAKQLADAERWLLNDYPALAQQLADGLARLKAADKLAERVNAELPAGCERLQPPSNARHESATDDRVELREVRRWVNRDGHPLGAIQFTGGEVPAGARQVLVKEEVLIPGRKPWWPSPIYADARLPALHKHAPDFWWP